jgi:hypothetical protein
VLLKFLQDAEFPLDPFGEDTKLFKRASERLRVALEIELDSVDARNVEVARARKAYSTNTLMA